MWRRRRATVAGLTSPGDEDPTRGDLSLPDDRGRDRCARVDDAQGKQPPARHRSRLPHTRGLPSPGSQFPRTRVGPGGRRWLCPAACRPGPGASTCQCSNSATVPLRFEPCMIMTTAARNRQHADGFPIFCLTGATPMRGDLLPNSPARPWRSRAGAGRTS